MCKCCQYYLESCYWHTIEKRFCYDESIAMYEEEEPPELKVGPKDEKNNNMMFDNVAFYDSVSVIAGRAVVTIDPMPLTSAHNEAKPIVQQPTNNNNNNRRLVRWQEEVRNEINNERLSRSVPVIFHDDRTMSKSRTGPKEEEEMDSVQDKQESLKLEMIDPELRRKSLRERRMSRSLYLKIDLHKELPLIRQQSMPKFYLDTPEDNQTQSTSMFRSPSATLMSPVPPNNPNLFMFDLSSIVRMEKEKVSSGSGSLAEVHQHDPRATNIDQSYNYNKSLPSSRLMMIKEKIKLRRAKSGVHVKSPPPTNLPHSHQHI